MQKIRMKQTHQLFKKGQSGNPKGKIKGSVNESTKKFARFKTLASEKYEEAFEMLWKNMEIGEGWAHQIFFKELVPKKVHQPTINVESKEGESKVVAIYKALPQFNELTHDEALNEIRVLANVDLLEDKKQEATLLVDLLPSDKIKLLHSWIEEEKNRTKE